ncbi:MAG: fused MFS/spermidine synthase, partial [Candidatus Krumholzibacteriia bacterium]
MRWSMRLLISCLFLFSGATALVYQVAWTRNLSLIFGASHQAVSIVLAAFMAGLALGGWVLGRVADRLHRPLRSYGLLEYGVGAAAVLLPLLLALVDRAYVAAALRVEGVTWSLNVLRATLAFAVLVIPTFFMGGTLPVLTRYVVHELGDFGPRLAWLYGINTAGAVVGASAAGFILLPRLGVTQTQLLAVLANVAIGAVAILADRRIAGPEVSAKPAAGAKTAAVEPRAASQAAASERGAKPRTPVGRGPASTGIAAPSRSPGAPAVPDRASCPAALRLAFLGTFVSGLCALALEVMWTRGIGMAIGTTTYSFTIMLAAFLVGITLGSTIHALVPLRRVHEAVQFGVALLVIGVSSAVVSQLIPRLPQIAVELNMRMYGGSQGVRTATTLLLSFAIMLVPATFMGIAFPLAGRARARLREQFGRSVGDIVGLNTLGGILGPLLAGFVLIPGLGLQNSMLLVCGLDLGYGLLVLSVYLGLRRPRLWPVAALAALAAVAIGAALPNVMPAWDLHTLGAFQNNVSVGYTNATGEIDVRGQLAGTQVLYYQEGRGSTVSVTESQGFRAVLINGKSGATDHHSDLQHEYLLGHLPVLLHPDPKSVLVIGLGAGLTLGGVTAHSGIAEITLVEIEPAVLGAARA